MYVLKDANWILENPAFQLICFYNFLYYFVLGVRPQSPDKIVKFEIKFK